MIASLIDVWNVETFDTDLWGDLEAHIELIRNYFLTSERQWLEREASDHTMPHPQNPHAREFIWVTEHIMRLMEERTIRAWHYTRMTDEEVAALRRNGIYLSTLGTIKERFDAQVAAGVFDRDIADRLFAESPFQSEQLDSRSDKFWKAGAAKLHISGSAIPTFRPCLGVLAAPACWRSQCRLFIHATATLRPRQFWRPTGAHLDVDPIGRRSTYILINRSGPNTCFPSIARVTTPSPPWHVAIPLDMLKLRLRNGSMNERT
jgi:hypothetical protein